MEVAFILGKDAHYYGAGIKPFVDISIGLNLVGATPYILLRKNQKIALKEIKEITEEKVNLITYEDLEEAIHSLRPEFLVTQDYSMKTLKGFSKQKKIVYAQILHGLNVLNKYSSRKSIKFTMGSLVPWPILTREYVKTLNKFDYIFTNSEFTRDILLYLYATRPAGVVYPPVGTNLRKYIGFLQTERKEGILVYLGHFPDFYLRNVFEEMKNLKMRKNIPIRLIVDNEVKLKTNDFEVYSGLSSQELAQLYSKSRITYTPTVNEMFGHVGAESLLFSTPAIIDSYHPFLEFFPNDTNAVKIARPNSSIYQTYEEMLDSNIDIIRAKEFIMNEYSPSKSAQRFIQLLS